MGEKWDGKKKRNRDREGLEAGQGWKKGKTERSRRGKEKNGAWEGREAGQGGSIACIRMEDKQDKGAIRRTGRAEMQDRDDWERKEAGHSFISYVYWPSSYKRTTFKEDHFLF